MERKKEIIKTIDYLECEATNNCCDKECYACNFIGNDGFCKLKDKIKQLKEYIIDKEDYNERC